MIPRPWDTSQPFVLQYTKIEPPRWRTFRDRIVADERAWGIIVLGGPDWSLHLYLGKWLVGLERTGAVN